MKCFERLVQDYICSSLPSTLYPLQFAYRPNQSMQVAIAHTLHTTLSDPDKKRNLFYIAVHWLSLLIAFNTIVPSRLVTKLKDLGLNIQLCMWIFDFLTGRPQVVWVGGHTSSILILDSRAPQGCVLSPLLYSLYAYDCIAIFNSNTTIKFADDTAVAGLITDNSEKTYLREVEDLTCCCQDNKLLLNVSKTKELIVDLG